MVEVNMNGSIVLATKNNKVALIDADTVVFASAVTCQYFEELLPREMYSDKEWDLVISDPGYCEANNGIYNINIDEAMEHSMYKIHRILDLSGCKDFMLHFTAGRESFRYTKVDKEYKANRLIDSQGAKTRPPYGLYQIKQEFSRRYPLKVKIWYECEADDAVWWLGNKYPDRYIVCSVDKDIIGATEVPCFNYFERNSYIHPKSNRKIDSIVMHYITPENPREFWYTQCLTGDDGDGIIGLYGIGKAKAKKLLLGCHSDKERWDKIVEAYESKGKSYLDALLNMRMVRLDQYNPETNVLKLWDPRKLK